MALLFGASKEKLLAERSDAFGGVQSKRILPDVVLFSCLFAFLGALPWMAEKMVSPRYPDQSQEFLAEKLVSVSNAPSTEEINTFVSQPDAFLQVGRVAYPRFFGKEDGLPSTNPWAAYAIRDYPRIGFLLLNQQSASVVFPTKRLSEFPHAANAIVLGCQRGDYVEARLVALPELDTVHFSEPFTQTCSP
jgi:hypothetical protein